MKLRKIIACICIFLTGCSNKNNVVSDDIEKETIQVVMLIGQSNASGVSKSEYLPNHFSQEQIDKFNNGYEKTKIAYQCEGFFGNTSPLQTFVNVKVGQGYNKQHFGPELGMADYLSKNYEKDIYIIKVAYGGTGLATDWKSPSFSSGKNGNCYDEFVDYAKARIEQLGQYYKVEVKAFCWMQGENDSCNDEYTRVYGNYLSMFVEDLRKEFKEYSSKNGIGFVDAAITKAWTNYQLINSAKSSVAQTNSKNIFLAEAEELSYSKEPEGSPDMAHLDSDAMITLGNMFAKALVDNFLD